MFRHEWWTAEQAREKNLPAGFLRYIPWLFDIDAVDKCFALSMFGFVVSFFVFLGSTPGSNAPVVVAVASATLAVVAIVGFVWGSPRHGWDVAELTAGDLERAVTLVAQDESLARKVSGWLSMGHVLRNRDLRAIETYIDQLKDYNRYASATAALRAASPAL